MAAQGGTHNGGCLGDTADPLLAPSLAWCTSPFQQGDAGEGVSGEELQQCGASFSLSCCYVAVHTVSESLKGLFYRLLLHKLEHDSALN